MGGGTGLIKLSILGPCLHFSKNYEMKSISNPALSIEIFTLYQNLSSEEYKEGRIEIEGKFARHPDFEDYDSIRKINGRWSRHILSRY